MNIFERLRAERLIAKRYEERGYVVTFEPPQSAIPFPLGNYKPAMLAIKGDEKIIVDVNAPGARSNSEAYFCLDQEVQKHPGWRFFLATVTEAELQENLSSVATNVSVESIRERLRSIDRLPEDPEIAVLGLPILWTAYVSALGLLASHENVQLDGYTDLSLLNQAYSAGVISFDEYEAARRLMTLRDRSVRSLDRLATLADCKQLRQMVGTILDQLATSPASALHH